MKTCNSATEARLIKESEKSLDKEFEKMGVKLYTYHITNNDLDLTVFSGITIVSDERHRKHKLVEMIDSINDDGMFTVTPATYMLKALADRDFVGVAICDSRDDFNRPHGRRNAKIRLVKHLKHIGR